jgi:hypothetical protein
MNVERNTMYAERLILETDEEGFLKKIPRLPSSKKIEAIFLIIDEKNNLPIKRTPHPKILGNLIIHGDIFSSVPIELWNLST